MVNKNKLWQIPVLGAILALGFLVVATAFWYERTSHGPSLEQRKAFNEEYETLARKGLDELRAIARADMAKHEKITINEVNENGKTIGTKVIVEADYRRPSIESILQDVGGFEERLEAASGLHPGSLRIRLEDRPRQICYEVLTNLQITARSHRNHHSWDEAKYKQLSEELLLKYFDIKEKEEKALNGS